MFAGEWLMRDIKQVLHLKCDMKMFWKGLFLSYWRSFAHNMPRKLI